MDESLGIARYLSQYLSIARRRFPFALVPFILIAATVIYFILLLPSVYRSTGKIAVESQQIPSDLVRSTVVGSAEQRIGFVKQVVMTDARMEDLIHRMGLYPEEVASRPMDDVIKKLRSNISVTAMRDPYASGATIAFTVSFDHTDPVIARAVATDLVDLFLAENSRMRNARANETAGFLRDEARRLNDKLRSLDQQLTEFKQKNSDALPESLTLRVGMLENAKFDLRAVERDIATTEQERRFLETQLETLGTRLPVQRGVPAAQMGPQERLQSLRSDLARASALYTEAHPDIARLKSMIAQTEAELVSHGRDKERGDHTAIRNPERVQIESKIATIDSRLVSLQDQSAELNGRIRTLQSQILKTPEVQQRLSQISFDYNATVKEHDQIRSKLQQAELGESLESQKMAERFVLLEPAKVPVNSERPKREILIALALIVALGTGVAVAFAAELLDNRVQDPPMLAALIGERPLAVVPYIDRAHERRVRLAAATSKWLAFAAVLAALIIVGLRHVDPVRDGLRQLYY